jgi:hypothetical protein
MDVQNDIPNVRYLWQQPYLAAALQTDTRHLPGKISKLAALEKERLNLDLDADKRIVVLDLTEAGSKSNVA